MRTGAGRSSWALRVGLGLPAAGVTLATLLALGGSWSWFLELFTHFRPQYLVVQLVVAAGFFLLRHLRIAVLLMLTAVPNAVVVLPYLTPLIHTRPAHAVPDGLSLVAANLLYSSEAAERVLAYVREQRPDILLLSEFTPRWRKRLRALDELYPHAVVLPRTNAWGMAVFSRWPLRDVTDLNLDDGDAVNIRATVLLPQGPVELWSLHLASPSRGELAKLRDRQLRNLARLLAVEPAMPRIVAGDFNVTAFSPRFREFLRATPLEDARRPFGLQVTWPAWPVPVWIAIDQVLVSRDVVVHRLASGPDIGSDHYPVELDFSLRETQADVPKERSP